MKQILGCFFLMTTHSPYAQIDFLGNWILKSKEYLAGVKYGNAVSECMIVTERKDSLIVENSETNSRISYTMNGSKDISFV